MFRFPWGDFHSLNLGWFLQKFNELREDWATAEAGIDGALDAEIQKAEDALTDVFAARDAAAASASAANSSALNASQSSLASMDARDQSRAARDAAQQAATNAAGSETAAGNSATAASNSAGAAATSATQAGNSATAAQNSATAAGNSATAAASSATAAGNSATAAAGSASAAGQSASDAEDAAASVEASSQQIATNAGDIINLKKSVADNLERLETLENNTLMFNRVYEEFIRGRYLSSGFSESNSYARNKNAYPAGTYIINAFPVGKIVVGYVSDTEGTPILTNYFTNKQLLTTTQPFYITLAYGHAITDEELAELNNNLIVQVQSEDSLEQSLSEIIAPVYNSTIAPNALSINDFFIYERVLYQVIAPIAAGGYISIGTNAIATTVAIVLKSLLN